MPPSAASSPHRRSPHRHESEDVEMRFASTSSGTSTSRHSHSTSPPASTGTPAGKLTFSAADRDYAPGPRLVIRNVHLPYDADDPTFGPHLYNVFCTAGRVEHIEAAAATPNGYGAQSPARSRGHSPSVVSATDRLGSYTEMDAQGRGILLPGLCHAHIHLDKCFLLDQCDELVTGHFQEALRVTAKAKSGFPHDPADVYARGLRLVTQSVECGVTAMRAHVEVDETVRFTCVDVGLQLRKAFREVCDVQIAVFAQDPLFASHNDDRPGFNYFLLQSASRRPGVSAIGSAPYVEPTTAHAKRNIDLVLDLAFDARLHADFHLDYNLEPSSEPLIWHLLARLRERLADGRWHPGAAVAVGHATRLTLFGADEWARVRALVADARLPVTFVGLPASDMYAMGPRRGTLHVPRLAAEHGLRAAMAVNNVENAFTPQGPVDPLALCPLAVAVFQAGTKADCRILLEAVTVNARLAIGALHKAQPLALAPAKGMPADFVLLHENDTAHGATLNPCFSRTTIYNGAVVARRLEQKWMLPLATPSPDPHSHSHSPE